MNITSIMIIFPNGERLGVIPIDRPTVPKAEKISKATGISPNDSRLSRAKIARAMTVRARKVMVIARRTVSTGIRRLNMIVLRNPLRVAMIVPMITAKVVVLIPPPVPPGLAPMNIRNKKKSSVGWVNWPMFKVLKPAVLAVTD